MNTSQAKYNAREAAKARKRRHMYYRLYLKNGKDIKAIARKYGVSYERIRIQIRQVEEELNG